MKTTRGKINVLPVSPKNSFLVPFQSANPPHGLTCLSNDKCVLMYDTKCLLVNLRQKHILEVIDFETEVN